MVENDTAAMLASSGTSASRGDDGFALTRVRAELKPASADRYNFRFAASRDLKDKIERLAELMGLPSVTEHLEEILDQALEFALEKKDPIRKEQRRAAREEKARVKPNQTPSQGDSEASRQEVERARYIPMAVRTRALRAAGYRCEYRGHDGQRCGARKNLEFDHVIAFAHGGSSGSKNIRVLCTAHNRRKAEEDFGAAFIAERIRRPAATT